MSKHKEVLRELSVGPGCGSEIAKRMKERTGIDITKGSTIYYILDDLLSHKLVEVIKKEGRKKTYDITKNGLEMLVKKLQCSRCPKIFREGAKHSDEDAGGNPVCPACAVAARGGYYREEE